MAIHGKKARFWLATKADPTTPVDISMRINSVGFPKTADEVESTTLADDDRTYVSGYKDNQINLDGRWDETIDAQLFDLNGDDARPVFHFWPNGRPVSGTPSSTQPRYSGVVAVRSYDNSASIGDVQGWTSTLRIEGAVTRAVS